MKQEPLTTWHWKRSEYERFVDLGLFEGKPVELIGGQLMVAEPHSSYHVTGISMADAALRAILPSGWYVRVQMPVALDEDSEPEPDLAVVRGAPQSYREAHPARPSLAVEVAVSSLAFDRDVKGSLYARAGVLDYWIVNLVDRVVEVHRRPVPDPAAVYGWRYGSVNVFGPPDSIALLALPSARVEVSALLP
jgi:Uma2 family endonuclease